MCGRLPAETKCARLRKLARQALPAYVIEFGGQPKAILQELGSRSERSCGGLQRSLSFSAPCSAYPRVHDLRVAQLAQLAEQFFGSERIGARREQDQPSRHHLRNGAAASDGQAQVVHRILSGGSAEPRAASERAASNGKDPAWSGRVHGTGARVSFFLRLGRTVRHASGIDGPDERRPHSLIPLLCEASRAVEKLRWRAGEPVSLIFGLWRETSRTTRSRFRTSRQQRPTIKAG